jgi:hypothetical protein
VCLRTKSTEFFLDKTKFARAAYETFSPLTSNNDRLRLTDVVSEVLSAVTMKITIFVCCLLGLNKDMALT